MAWVYFNPNPWRLNTDDCTVRTLCTARGILFVKVRVSRKIVEMA